MKILVSTHAVTRKIGGVFNAVSDLFTNKELKGVDIEIFSYWDEYVEEDRARWGNLKLSLFKAYPFLYSRTMRKAILTSDADILHTEGIWRYPHLLMAQWSKKVKRPIVCSPHGMLDPYIIKEQGKIKRGISDMFFQKSLESVTCYHALCLKEMEDIRTYGLKQPVAIIPNGVNLPSKYEKYEKTDNLQHILFLGRIHKKKGIDLLIHAVGAIKKEQPELLDNCMVDIVGWDHENTRCALETLIKQYGINNNIKFHGGLYGHDKARMYATCDAYILPSHGEGLPMTVLEAWSWKKPVVITPQCHLPEGYENNAAIKIDDNIESVKEGLLRLMTMNNDKLNEMGINGYNLVKEKFTWDKAAQKMMMVYDWLLGKQEKPDFVYE